jgi:hypothetical protein
LLHWRERPRIGTAESSKERAGTFTVACPSQRRRHAALIEGEASLACHAVGLDPGIGLLHADQKARDSLALDVMEPIRPEAERFLVDLLSRNTFRARDFHEARSGNCRIRPPLTHRLAETLPIWTTLLAPVAETVARRLVHAAKIGGSPTPLTQANRRRGRAALGHTTRQALIRAQRLHTCKTCGAQITDNRMHCVDCIPEARARQRAEFADSGPAALAALRTRGADPAHGGDAAERRAAAMRKRHRERAEWQPATGAVNDPGEFTREILPRIQNVPLSRLAEATALSLRYVALIRRGERVPHPRHWTRFESLAGSGARGDARRVVRA